MRAAGPSTRSQVTAAGILTLAGAIRVANVLLTRPALVSDPADYQRIALSLVHGHGFGPTVLAAGGGPSAFRAPLYPVFLAGVYSVTGVSVQAARLVQALIGIGTVALIGALARQILNDRAALLAMAIAAGYPALVVGGSPLVSEPLYLPLELAAVVCAMEYRRRRGGWGWLVLSGSAAGLGVLVRPIGAVLIVGLAVLVGARRGPWWRRAGPAVAIAGVALALVVPWTVRNAARFHALVPVTDYDGFDFAGVYNDQAAADRANPALWRPPVYVPVFAPLFRDPTLNEVALNERLRAGAFRYAQDHPAYLARVVFWNTVRLFDLTGPRVTRSVEHAVGVDSTAADAVFVGSVMVGALAAASLFTGVRRAVPAGLWLAMALPVAATVVVLGTTRYRAPLEPFLVVLAAGLAERLVWARREPAPYE